MLASYEKWLKMSKELIIRLTEMILENRFLDINGESDDFYMVPETYTYEKEFIGKYGLKKDFEEFPKNAKFGEIKNYSLSFFMKPLSLNKSPKDYLKHWHFEDEKELKQLQMLEVWNISLEIFR